MEHAPERRIAADDIEAVAVCLSVVDDNGLIKLKRKLDLADKQRLLLVLVPGIPIVIKPYLADGNAFRVVHELYHFIKALVGKLVHILRVPADGGVHKVVFFRKSYRGAAAFKVAARIDDQTDVFLRHGREYVKAVGVERASVVMRMGVKYHLSYLRYIIIIASLAIPAQAVI